jgi:hypothetical protein
MRKKLFIALLLVLVIGSSTYAQLVIGGSGALRADSTMSASDLYHQYKSGQNIFYGPFVEFIFNKLGVGLAANFSFFEDLGTKFMDYDVNGYLSYHIFGGRAFLDPFGELGVGLMAYNYANSSDNPNVNGDPISGNFYWYGGFGLGLNLGPIGIFGKMDYNFRINRHLQGKDNSGNSYDIPYYGSYTGTTDALGNPIVNQYVPNIRFIIGAKILI